MGSTPSTDIQTVLDELKSRGVSDDDIESFLSYIKENTIEYEWIVSDVSDRAKSKVYSFFKDELKNDTLFDVLCSIIRKKNTSSKRPVMKQIKEKRRMERLSNKVRHKSHKSARKSRSVHSVVNAYAQPMQLCASSPRQAHRRRSGGSAYKKRFCSARASDFNRIGVSLGGSRDTNNFRKCIDSNTMPSINSITYNGLLYEYYFDTNSAKHNDETKDSDESTLFYPSYCYAKINYNKEREYFMSVGLNSNIREDEFKRKHLNLVILLDVSGSMTASFDADNEPFDIDINGEWRQILNIGDQMDVKERDLWYHAEVTEIKNDENKVKIHYIGWETKYDEYISANSNRIAPFNSSKTKMNSAKSGVLSILKQLTAKDRLAVVTFNKNAEIIQDLSFVDDLDLNELKSKIENVSANGGTNFEIGYNKCIEMYSQLFSSTEYQLNLLNDVDSCNYDHRIIALTDAQPNEGRSTSSELFSFISKSAQNTHIYTTFIGVGLDFNSSLIEKISCIRGCNYYCVKTTKEFDDKMNSEFEFMVTPLVFNVCLTLKCEGNSLQIERVYGSNDDETQNILNSGEIARIHTLFPSKKSESTGETKGGIQLIKLKKLKKDPDHDDNATENVELQVTFEDRNGKKYSNVQNVQFSAPKEHKMNINNDMIEMDEKEENEGNINFYDNKGIRKAILLCQYVDLMKQWIKANRNNVELNMSDKYKQIFVKYMKHFKVEMSECDDDTLQKEVDLMQKLINLSN